MKKFVMVISAAFAVTLAIVIGTRLSPDAMAVVVGIVCGVLASIPMTAILVWTLRVRDRQLEAQLGPQRMMGQYPPVVVVNGQGSHGNGAPVPVALGTGHGVNGSRSFKVVGQETTETNGDLLPPIWDEL